MKSFLFFVLILLICIYYFQKQELSNLIIENLEDSENPEDDYDPMKADYTKLIKSVNEMGFNKRGDSKGFNRNVKGSNRIVKGSLDQQKQVVKGNRGIGTRLVYNTGFKCNDSSGNEQDLHTYFDNIGNENDGLITEFRNATGKLFKKSTELFSAAKGLTDDSCSKVKLKLITNSGKKDTKTVYIQNSELDSIDKSNIEKFSNHNDIYKYNKILINSKSLYDDNIIFIYFIGINALCLYLFYKLMDKNN